MTVLDPRFDELKFEIQEEAPPRPRIRVIGVGGAGSNAVAYLMSSGLEGVEFCAVNTDVQALRASPVPNKLAIGMKLTGGQGAGADPAIGKQAALDDTERLTELLVGAAMVFVVAGLGSGTGTGAAPVIAALARGMDALTVGIVTRPFSFEGPRRIENAERGLEELREAVDALVTIPNDRLLGLAKRGTSLLEAFRMAHEIIRQAVAEIVEIIATPGLINRDFSDLRAIMRGTGLAVMGTGSARGENAAVEATRQAINCPLVEGATIAGACNVLVQVSGSSRLGLHELSEACTLIREVARNEDLQISFGVVINESMADAVKVTVIATGFAAPTQGTEARPAPAGAWLGSTPPPLSVMTSFAQPESPQTAPVPQYEAAPALAEAAATQPDSEDFSDLEDLEAPAFLRYRRLWQ